MDKDAKLHEEVARQYGKEMIRIVRAIVLLPQVSLMMAQIDKMWEVGRGKNDKYKKGECVWSFTQPMRGSENELPYEQSKDFKRSIDLVEVEEWPY